MPKNRKLSPKPRQTESTKVRPAATARATKTIKPARNPALMRPDAGNKQQTPAADRSLLPVWIGLVAVIAVLLVAQYGSRLQISWPNMAFTMPQMPDVSDWFRAAQPVEPEPVEIEEPEPPLEEEVDAKPSSTRTAAETEKLKRQLLEAEERIQLLQSAVDEKDKALQYETNLRGQSLLAQYARLIEHALQKGLPFPWELEQLQHFSYRNEQIPEAANLAQMLVPYAQGVPSVEKLRQDFQAISDEIYIRWRKEGMGSGISAVFWRMLHQIISIRKVGLVEGNTPEAIVARAEYHLNKGDVAQAYQELLSFEGSYASIVEPWLEKARMRMEAEKMIKALHALAQKAVPGSSSQENNAADLSDPFLEPESL